MDHISYHRSANLYFRRGSTFSPSLPLTNNWKKCALTIQNGRFTVVDKMSEATVLDIPLKEISKVTRFLQYISFSYGDSALTLRIGSTLNTYFATSTSGYPAKFRSIEDPSYGLHGRPTQLVETAELLDMLSAQGIETKNQSFGGATNFNGKKLLIRSMLAVLVFTLAVVLYGVIASFLTN